MSAARSLPSSSPVDTSSFLKKRVAKFGKDAFRLGIALNYGIDGAGFRAAVDRGVNYVFWSPLRQGAATSELKSVLKTDREKMIVATGPLVGWPAGSVRRGAEGAMKTLGVDYLDLFQLFWLGVTSAWTDGTVDELVKLREEGKVRSIGISIHDRVRAGKLAEDSPLDAFMIRYNAAHPGAEREIFPHLEKRKPAVIAYTATSWRRLLKPPRGWTGPTMTASDCYRFCLSSPHVDVALTGPKTQAEVLENLDGIAKGPLTAEEEAWIRPYGKAVHG